MIFTRSPVCRNLFTESATRIVTRGQAGQWESGRQEGRHWSLRSENKKKKKETVNVCCLLLEQTMVPSPLGHSQHQQPISSPNRTSRDAPPPPDLTERETHQQAHHPAPAGPMSIAWGLSGVDHQNPQLNPTLLNSIVTGTMLPASDSTSGHHSHLPQVQIDADFAYGCKFVVPPSM
jgi:hypothetical protein